MEVKTIRVLWDGSNAIRKDVLYYWSVEAASNKSFKKFCSMRAGKEQIKKAALNYILKAQKEIEIMDIGVDFLDAYIVDDMLYLDVETNTTQIANVLSFRASSNLWFEEVTFKHLRSL